MNENKLTLREALASDRLEDFVGQEVTQGAELLKGSELERALALLVTRRRLPEHGAFEAWADTNRKPGFF